MASFCNKCGAPVSGVFCVKCGFDTRQAAGPPPQPAAVIAPPAPPSPAPSISPVAAGGVPPAAKFCNKCGKPSSGTTFCNQCGADLRQASSPSQHPPCPASVSSASQTQAKGSPLIKILVGFVVVVITLGALAAGGVYYVVYRVKQKVHEVARDVPGLGSSSDSGSTNSSSGASGSNGGISGDPCRLLSKEEVARAVGVGIVATESTEGGCSYLAHGNSSDMTAKHLAAMAGTKGADAQAQQTIQNLTGGLGKMLQAEGHQETSDSNGNVPVFAFGVDNNAAETQMNLNQKTLGILGSQQGIPGIGDQAFDEAGAMMMVRKGDKLIRIMYSTCPCSVEAIKPLAKKLADRV